jgi:hypothetical protein
MSTLFATFSQLPPMTRVKELSTSLPPPLPVSLLGLGVGDELLESEQGVHDGAGDGEQPLPLAPLRTLQRHGVRSEQDPVFTMFTFTFKEDAFS